MRLTVGPLPAAVYWRRRALVLGGISVLILIIALSCGGPGSPNPGNSLSVTTSPKVLSTRPSETPGVSPTSAAPTSPPFTLPGTDVGSGGVEETTPPTASAGTGPCTDAEMSVGAVASVSAVARGKPVDFTLKFKNVSNRTCTRDLGAPMQELQVLQGATVIWSSDDCKSNSGKSIRTFQPGQEAPFTLRWTGRVSRTGTGAVICDASAPAPAIGAYSLVGRLDKKFSEPYAFRLT